MCPKTCQALESLFNVQTKHNFLISKLQFKMGGLFGTLFPLILKLRLWMILCLSMVFQWLSKLMIIFNYHIRLLWVKGLHLFVCGLCIFVCVYLVFFVLCFRDVPGLTRAIIPLLKKNNVQAITIGGMNCNKTVFWNLFFFFVLTYSEWWKCSANCAKCIYVAWRQF